MLAEFRRVRRAGVWLAPVVLAVVAGACAWSEPCVRFPESGRGGPTTSVCSPSAKPAGEPSVEAAAAEQYNLEDAKLMAMPDLAYGCKLSRRSQRIYGYWGKHGRARRSQGVAWRRLNQAASLRVEADMVWLRANDSFRGVLYSRPREPNASRPVIELAAFSCENLLLSEIEVRFRK
jgi:hypothetical protein